jgi:dihydroorotate dehydrogenase (NAD+) catalytic subunit
VADLTTTLAGITLRTPIMLASGTAGYGAELAGLVDFAHVGAIVTKTVTPAPRAGNRPPRLAETPGGLLNAIGLENVGVEAFLAEKLPAAAALGPPVVVSIAGGDPDGFARLAALVGSRPETAAVEVNISCPNVERARRPAWDDPEAAACIVAAARGATDKPLLVKLSPNTADALGVAEAAERAGADALVVANTLPGMRIDVGARRPALGNTTGGLSGRAILPVNLALVWKIAGGVSVPVVGSGGIAGAEDALEYLMAGARAFQVGTALFLDPAAPSLIARGLLEHMRQDGMESVQEYVGLARGASCRSAIATA